MSSICNFTLISNIILYQIKTPKAFHGFIILNSDASCVIAAFFQTIFDVFLQNKGPVCNIIFFPGVLMNYEL